MATDSPPKPTMSLRRRLAWQQATVVRTIVENDTARTLVLDVPGWIGHRAGQHVDLRLTADDGYQATRSYSLSAAPGEAPQVTVGRVDDGEVSSFLVDEVGVGDTFEVRGPIGGVFVWEPTGAPLLLIGGGTGLAPLRAMWRVGAAGAPIEVRCSFRDIERVLWPDELAEIRATIHLTREGAGDGYRSGRIDAGSIMEALARLGGTSAKPAIFVCGPTRFVEPIIGLLGEAGADRRSVHAERFG